MVQVSPKPLPSLASICKVFKRGADTVRKWYAEGAPIWKDGDSYGSDYHELNAWLLQRDKKSA